MNMVISGMLKEHSTIVRRTAILIDLLLLAATFWGAFYLRFQRPPGSEDWNDYGWITIVFIPVLLFNLYRAELYHKLRYLTLTQISRRLAAAFGVALALAAAILFLSHATHYSRLLLLYFTGLSLLILGTLKLALKIILDRLRAKGANYRSALLIGSGEKLKQLQTIFHPGNPYGLKIAGVIDLNHSTQPLLFAKAMIENIVDEIYFALPRKPQSPAIDPYLELAEAAGKTCKIILNINENRISKCDFARLAELPMVVLHPVTLDPDQLLLKRTLDLGGAVVGMLINLALFPLIAAAIKLDSPGPIFFVQTRAGQNGRLFRLYKYRTMYQGAEALQQELMAQNELNGAVFKLTNDPRITRVGRCLRKTSLDELPQFWNVLTGDMSLVGTRPPTPDEVEKYDLRHHRRLSMKPGITGLWQVSGRNQITDFDQIVALDTDYIDRWSLWLDCRILGKTFLVIWSGK
ncbi:MAG: sugar transferase [Deltaproteobacteria bacterium]|nr:sugar transferase [Deltaproteobacteria bacterium]